VILLDTSAWVEFLRATGSEVNGRRLNALMGRCAAVPCISEDYRIAAEIRRATRRAGASVRSSLDCLIAAVAIRADMSLLHADRDFEAIARHSTLQLA
jgi:predicted nucleic acid-binding protein